ncbi:hypothetical protein [Microbacterium sp. No. 7]|nr:hypothetical protein [Microbacterium sp. No. 7]
MTCSRSQYYEKVGDKIIWGNKAATGMRSQLTTCYTNWKYSAYDYWA